MQEKVRDPQHLWQIVQQQGFVDVPVKRVIGAVLGILMLVAGPIMVIAGLLGFLADLGLGALMMLTTGVALFAVGIIVYRKAKQERGPVWRVSPHGIAVSGVGPIPWNQLMPPEQRWVSNPHDDGNILAMIMPLTPEGMARAEALPEHARRLFDPAARNTLIQGQLPLEFVRIVDMQGVGQGTWVAFLAQMHATYR